MACRVLREPCFVEVGAPLDTCLWGFHYWKRPFSHLIQTSFVLKILDCVVGVHLKTIIERPRSQNLTIKEALTRIASKACLAQWIVFMYKTGIIQSDLEASPLARAESRGTLQVHVIFLVLPLILIDNLLFRYHLAGSVCLQVLALLLLWVFPLVTFFSSFLCIFTIAEKLVRGFYFDFIISAARAHLLVPRESARSERCRYCL